MQQRIFFLNTQNSSYLGGKSLEVPRFKQCVLAGSQNQAGLRKNLMSPQDNCHLLLINATDLSHCIYLKNLKKKHYR